MSSRIVLLNLISSFFVLALVTTASAQTRTVGVNIGEKFRYSVTTSWNSDPRETVPPYITDCNNTEWLEVSITAVSGTNITGNITTHYWNDTETTVESWVDVDTGSWSESNDPDQLAFCLISANLTAGDNMYNSDSIYPIDETVPRTYLGGVRDTNNMNATTSYRWINTSYRLYWDKLTGVPVDVFMGSTSEAGNYTTSWSIEFQIISSDLWVVNEFSTWISTILILIVLTSAIMIISRQRARARIS